MFSVGLIWVERGVFRAFDNLFSLFGSSDIVVSSSSCAKCFSVNGLLCSTAVEDTNMFSVVAIHNSSSLL